MSSVKLEANGDENGTGETLMEEEQEQRQPKGDVQQSQAEEPSATAATKSVDEKNVCRDFLNNVCFRGSRCKYYHPPDLVAKYDQLRKEDKIQFCKDFQNRGCPRESCKYVHCSWEDKEEYERHGRVTESLARAIVAATGQEVVDGRPLCKEYLSGHCSRGARCRFWHINPRHELQHGRRGTPCPLASSGGGNLGATDVDAAAAHLRQQQLQQQQQQVYPSTPAAAVAAAPPSPYANFIYSYYQECRHRPPALPATAAAVAALGADRKRMRSYYDGDSCCEGTRGSMAAAATAAFLGVPPSAGAGGGGGTPDYYAALLEENVSLRRRVDLLKQTILELTTQNDQLLAEIARLRAKYTAANINDLTRV